MAWPGLGQHVYVFRTEHFEDCNPVVMTCMQADVSTRLRLVFKAAGRATTAGIVRPAMDRPTPTDAQSTFQVLLHVVVRRWRVPATQEAESVKEGEDYVILVSS